MLAGSQAVEHDLGLLVRRQEDGQDVEGRALQQGAVVVVDGHVALGAEGGRPLAQPRGRDESQVRRPGQSVEDVGDVLLEADGHELLLWPLLNYGDHSYDGLLDMMEDPISVHGLGDSGAHVGLVCDASTTTYMLTHWVRDRTRGRRLPLEVAVRRLTRDPADLYGLGDRGAVTPGRRADLNLIDLDRVGITTTEMLHDLPAGGKRLVQRAEGYETTVVAGEVIRQDGKDTGALPGRLVRGARRA